MAAVVKSTKAGYDAYSASVKTSVISELMTAGPGAAFQKLVPVYGDSDGKLRPAYDDSTGVKFDGFSASTNDSDGGLPCSLLTRGAILEWLEDSDDYTPFTLFYVGATNQLETTGTTPVALSINNKEIVIIAGPGVRS